MLKPMHVQGVWNSAEHGAGSKEQGAKICRKSGGGRSGRRSVQPRIVPALRNGDDRVRPRPRHLHDHRMPPLAHCTGFSREPFSVRPCDFICLASFLFPFYADELNTMTVRIRNGENLLHAHSKHIYQLLANEKGIAHWKVSVGYGLLQGVVGMSVLWVKPLGLTPVIVLLAVWFTGFFAFGYFVRRSVAPLRNPEML